MPELADYLGGLEPSTRSALEHVRDLVTELVPEAYEGVSYGMAALKYQQKPLLGLLAAQHHLSIFPFSPRIVEAVRDRLTGYELSKGTIRFTVAMPLPDDVVRDIVALRVEEILAKPR